MKCVDDFRLRFGSRELVPIMIGGMGVDISTAELALEAARLGGIGHISDAMLPTVTDKRYKTKFVSEKQKQYKLNILNADKSIVKFDLEQVAEASRIHVRRTMEAKRGDGMIFINCMEKLTMNAPRETLRTRMLAALDEGAASGFVRHDAGSSALSRRQARHHRIFRARLAVVPAQECQDQPFARLHRGGRPVSRWSLRFRYGLGAIRFTHHYH
jgi:NAD(P)H-dependent flavin oxidoreductase YrpB (nitropropane dioxygenase family)